MITRRALLELLYHARVGQVPVRYVVRERRHRLLVHVAREVNGSPRHAASAASQPVPTASSVDESEHRCWVEDASHFRVDSEHGRTVVAGNETFIWRAPGAPGVLGTPGGGGTVCLTLRREPPAGAAAMEGRSLLAEGDPELVEATTYLGRPAYLVRSAPASHNEPAQSYRLREPTSADERRVVVDAEHGLILRDEALFAGESMYLHEITELEFNPTFAADTFAFLAPDGGEPTIDESSVTDSSSIDAASELLGSRCLVPASMALYMQFPVVVVHRYRDGRVAVETRHQDGAEAMSVSVFQSTSPPIELPPEAVDALRAGGHWSEEGEGHIVHVLHGDMWVRVSLDRRGSLRRRTGRLMTTGAEAPPELDALAIAHDLVPYPTTAPRMVQVDVDGQPVG